MTPFLPLNATLTYLATFAGHTAIVVASGGVATHNTRFWSIGQVHITRDVRRSWKIKRFWINTFVTKTRHHSSNFSRYLKVSVNKYQAHLKNTPLSFFFNCFFLPLVSDNCDGNNFYLTKNNVKCMFSLYQHACIFPLFQHWYVSIFFFICLHALKLW